MVTLPSRHSRQSDHTYRVRHAVCVCVCQSRGQAPYIRCAFRVSRVCDQIGAWHRSQEARSGSVDRETQLGIGKRKRVLLPQYGLGEAVGTAQVVTGCRGLLPFGWQALVFPSIQKWRQWLSKDWHGLLSYTSVRSVQRSKHTPARI